MAQCGVIYSHNAIPKDLCEVIDILESDNFNSDATEFEIDHCATLCGKLRWALLATKLGDSPALINIEEEKSNR